jgi:hypothetical protein
VKLADSAFGERPLLIRLRSAQGDWRIVKSAKWLVAWNAAADPESIEGTHGASFRPSDIRDVFPVEHRVRMQRRSGTLAERCSSSQGPRFRGLCFFSAARDS